MTKEKNKLILKRVNMNLPESLVEKVVAFGEEKGLNVTSSYIVLLNQALEFQQTLRMLPLLPSLLDIYEKENSENMSHLSQKNDITK